MITPDAKCVVNGPKVNEAIDAINSLLNMNIIIGNVKQPQIQYSSSAVQIVIPPGGGSTNEELDIVDSNNTAAKRWFLTTLEQGSADTDGDAGGGGENPNIGSPGGQSNTSGALKDRDNLGGGGGGGVNANRDQLAVDLPAGALKDNGGGQRPLAPQGELMPLAPGGGQRPLPGDPPRGGGNKGAFGGVVDAFGNELYADGTKVTPGGARFDDGSRPANQSQPTSVDPPLPGATPPNRPRIDDMFVAGNEDARKQKQTDYKGDPRDFEAQRRGREEYRKNKQRNSTETFLQDLATKKRQVKADKLALRNKYS